jgi:uncharacterized protein YlxW (UPF0749 family)
MRIGRIKILIGIICALTSVLVITQYRTQRQLRPDMPRSGSDQATYISKLYESTTELQQQANELEGELRQTADSRQRTTSEERQASPVTEPALGTAKGHSSLDMRLANGEVEVTGPGVTVMVDGDLTVFELQDLVNELRNASAEAITVNGVRVVTRSAIVADKEGSITVDGQQLSQPYRLEAIGEPDTLLRALERKGGLIALLETRNSALRTKVLKYDIWDKGGWLHLPRTERDFSWTYGQAAP